MELESKDLKGWLQAFVMLRVQMIKRNGRGALMVIGAWKISFFTKEGFGLFWREAMFRAERPASASGTP
jgi:hypothetical protein